MSIIFVAFFIALGQLVSSHKPCRLKAVPSPPSLLVYAAPRSSHRHAAHACFVCPNPLAIEPAVAA
ncbi:hypothetical protein PHLCEN_2v7242 [Hermanssonia centrifuga]|uniref:Secreted protein n=1 Tax=Hermanssonia centrifuga TaxID=98765 RepID=A0A2R6NXF1_9APHY|nr:hypothetical protein PHLCEN_2v7242 [Hermanssonia centrifuga]